MRRTAFAVLAATFVARLASAQGDPEVVARLIESGVERSHAWDYMVYLSETIGPRLTGSSGCDEASAWTRDEFAALGIPAWLEKWGDVPVRFDRGPSSARMVEPMERDFEFTARAWSAGTDGPVRGHIVRAPKTLEELDAIRDDLEGVWLLDPAPSRRRRRRRGGDEDDDAAAAARALREQLRDELADAGIAGRIYGARSDLVTTGAERGWREMSYDDLPTDVTVYVRRIDYDAMNSRLADGETVEVEIDLRHHFVEGPIPVYNTVAEIRGTEKPDEVVILSGHLDSWDGPGTEGAQDNATGCAAVLDAARMLVDAGAKPKRTIRFILWTGEEQGLLGSRGYVESLTDEEKAGVSAVFVEDGGTGFAGGLLVIGSQVPMLEAATAAANERFPDMPLEMIIRDRMPRGGGSDHSSFNRVGIPGYFWQEYGAGGMEGKNYRFIHHTQHDIVRYAVREQVVQAAVCAAVTAYNLAMADDLLPRQLPDPPEPTIAAAPSAAEEAPFNVTDGPLSGTWEARLTGDDAPDFTFTFVFEMSDDGRARGEMKSDFAGGPLERVKFDAETGGLTFIRNTEMMGVVKYTATVEGDVMKGSLKAEEFGAEFEAKRSKPEIAKADDAESSEDGQEPEDD